MLPFVLFLGFVAVTSGQLKLTINPKNAANNGSGVNVAQSMPLDLSALVNNRAFAKAPGDANFDGAHSGYPAKFLPSRDFEYAGVKFDFPQYTHAGNDNVLAEGQLLTPASGRYFSIHILAAAETAIATGFVTATYADNTTTSGAMLVDPWWDWPYPYGGDLIFPYYLTNSTVDYNRSMIFRTINWLDSTKELVSLQLPNVTAGSSNGPGGASENTRLHIFAVSLVPATECEISLEIQYARSTQAWIEGSNKTQLVEVTVNNVGDKWILAKHSVQVSVSAPGLTTVIPASIHRLRPGDQATVRVGVENTEGTRPGATGPALVNISGIGVQAEATFNATYGIVPYDATYDSIYSHESPTWYSDAKFGIFIHWGVYSVPGWGNVGKNG